MRTVFCASLIVLATSLCSPAAAQVQTLKEKAVAAFKGADYTGAIEYLKQALAETPVDADVYYYLGYFTHYLCYDSVPLTGFGREKSDEVLCYLGKAVEIDPHYGNAYYFIGAEYGARARDEMQRRNAGGVAEQFRLGRQAGGYPDWMLEFGRNTLRSCDREAILFTGGDADTNPVHYLQIVEGYRPDVTAIPVAMLGRPWFVAALKQGMEGVLRAGPISWSDAQIASMRPYKWKTNTVRIPVTESVRRKYGSDRQVVEWELTPNLGRGESLGLLSPGRAVFADVLLTNQWERPVYFSMGCAPGTWDGLRQYVQVCGFAQRLLPFEPPSAVDIEPTKTLLLDEKNFRSLSTLRDSDMPRASNMLQNYRSSFLQLVYAYSKSGDRESARAVLAAMNERVPKDVLPVTPDLARNIEAFEQMLNKSE
jgi:tetratricopeptide (TPR) repeat protein